MIIIGLLIALVAGGASVESAHYAQCKRLNFAGKACKTEKSLSKLSR